MNNHIDKLASLFESFPGIGKRQARRFVYFLLHKDNGYIHELTSGIINVKSEIDQCNECFRFFPKTSDIICPTCLEASDSKQIMIVEKDADFENLHKTKVYEGKYFILGGHINSNEKKRSFARVDRLINRVTRDIESKNLDELIFGLSISPEAEHTQIRLYTMLKDQFPNLVFTTLGRGLSTGTELEYSDTETLKHAFNSRISQ
jgi:recombination protein RecR